MTPNKIVYNRHRHFCRCLDIKHHGKVWEKDPRTVVIDEFIGVWILPVLIAPGGEYVWFLALLGFAAFRIIDILKPLGCRWIDKNVEGGWGVMLDDALAGIYALIIVLAVKTFCI